MTRQEKISFIQSLIKGRGALHAPLTPVPSWIANDCDHDPDLIKKQLEKESGNPAEVIEKEGKFYNTRRSIVKNPSWFNN